MIQLPLDHLDPTLINHFRRYLSACPIKHPLLFSVSCGLVVAKAALFKGLLHINAVKKVVAMHSMRW